MADREKVIVALVECEPFRLQCSKEQCPYYKDNHCLESLHNDALSLLKEQEPLAVYEGKVNKCVCGNEINRYWHPEYCGFCGKKLEWY